MEDRIRTDNHEEEFILLPFLNSGKTNIGLDIGTESIKIVQLETKKDLKKLTKIAFADIPEGSMGHGKIENPQALGDAIRIALKNNGLASKNIALAIPSRHVVIRQVRFPIMEPEELKESLKWELDRYLPLSSEDAVVDFHILQNFSDNNPPEMEVALVGANKNLIDTYLQLAEAAEISLQALEVSSFAFLRTLNSDYLSGTVVIINASNLDMEMTILTDGLLRFSRVITNGPLDILLQEIQRSIDFHHLQNRDEAIAKIILSGEYTQLEELSQALVQELDLDVEVANPLASVEPNPSFDPTYLEKVAPSLGVALGLALRKSS